MTSKWNGMASLSVVAFFVVLGACGTNTSATGDVAATSEASGAGYRSEKGQFFVKEQWDAPPSTTGRHEVTLAFRNAAGEPLMGITDVTVKPWMKIHGHGAPGEAIKVTNQGNGSSWKVEGLTFTMPGPWELEVRARKDGVEDKAEVKVEIKD